MSEIAESTNSDESKVLPTSESANSSESANLPMSISARLGKLQFHLSGKFRVLQFADVQDAPKISKDTIRLIESACDAVKPDIVIFTGNQIAGYVKDFADTFVRRRWSSEAFDSSSGRFSDNYSPKDESYACLLYTSDAADDFCRV